MKSSLIQCPDGGGALGGATVGLYQNGGYDEKLITIYNTEYAIPAVFSYSQKHEKMPAVILCHGTGSQKNEVGNLFAEMSKRLLNIGIASIRLDYAGCGDSKACQTKLSFCGEVNDTKKVYQ